MEFYIRQKMFNLWKDKYTIKDEAGNDVFEVKSDLSLLRRLTIYDMAGNPLLRLKKRYWRFLPRWDILDINKKLLFIVKRKFVPFVPKFKIICKEESKNGTVYNTTGNIFSWNYRIMDDNNKDIIFIDKKIMSWADTYAINSPDANNVMLGLAVAIIFDGIMHQQRSKTSYLLDN